MTVTVVVQGEVIVVIDSDGILRYSDHKSMKLQCGRFLSWCYVLNMLFRASDYPQDVFALSRLSTP